MRGEGDGGRRKGGRGGGAYRVGDGGGGVGGAERRVEGVDPVDGDGLGGLRAVRHLGLGDAALERHVLRERAEQLGEGTLLAGGRARLLPVLDQLHRALLEERAVRLLLRADPDLVGHRVLLVRHEVGVAEVLVRRAQREPLPLLEVLALGHAVDRRLVVALDAAGAGRLAREDDGDRPPHVLPRRRARLPRDARRLLEHPAAALAPHDRERRPPFAELRDHLRLEEVVEIQEVGSE